MIETIFNAVQLIFTLISAGFAAYRAIRTQKHAWLLCSLASGVYFLGDLYWQLYLVFYDCTPHYSYIPELGWRACCIFLLILLTEVRGEREKPTRVKKVLFIIPVFTVGMSSYYALYDGITTNLIIAVVMKLLPVMFYLIVFGAGNEEASNAVLMTAAGFATFENVCYLTQNGAESIFALAVHGFGTGAMHIVCGCMAALSITLLRGHKWIKNAGALALLAVSMTFHGSYNILVSQTGIAAYIGYAIPLVSAVTILVAVNRKKDLFKDKK